MTEPERSLNQSSIRHRRSLAVLRAVWLLFLIYTIFGFVWSYGGFTELVRFDRIYEDSYIYFARWMSYFAYLQVVELVVSLLSLFYFLVAIFIFLRKSNDLLGFLTSIALLGVPESWGWGFFIDGLVVQLKSMVWVFCFSYLLFVFPNGRFIPASLVRTVHLAFLVIFLAGLAAAVTGWSWFFGIALIGVGLLNISGLLSQVYRFLRASTPSEKQQTKWVMYSILLLVFWTIFYPLNPGNAWRFEMRAVYGLFVILAGFLVIAMIPVAFTISILRYRLFDIDLIIRRTLQYGLLTGLLAVLYLGTVVILQAAVTAVTGETSSPSVTVVSTLLIAAAFNPLRLRLQKWINRRFYRSTYNAERVLEQFAVTARDEVELDRLAESILAVTQATVQPQRVSLWLKTGTR